MKSRPAEPLGHEINLPRETSVALLTGGADKPYTFGLATALISKRMVIDLIGNDDLDCPDFHGRSGVTFHNLRGDQQSDAKFRKKGLVAGKTGLVFRPEDPDDLARSSNSTSRVIYTRT